ncbi:MAG: carboxypeptidase regulatory-like domain-containing protein [Microscillaceae bacterium]|nr:carboxypeptidase regulatory-like domain-containing protein [Microscillaceae bacterium]MDW8460082.1 carboxypeptidase regulatory-like domain-containing protein [Cytophagales bacterium]
MLILAKVLILLCLFWVFSCKNAQKSIANSKSGNLEVPVETLSSTCPHSIKQGISGRVWWREGDFMPTIGDAVTGKNKPVARTLNIYRLVKESQTTKQDRFYTRIDAELVKTVKSNEYGCFAVELDEGKYSILSVEQGKGLYANSFDGEMNIFPVQVEKGKVTQIEFYIDYMATY